jgi:flavin reductase (DIM6/NTAB) family NADH-FMN oxidoreductase RutF
MKKRSLPLSKVYGLLETGPVVLVSSAYKNQENIMTMSWHTMMEFEPPLIGCVISNRDYTFDMLKASKQCVINIPTAELAKQVVGCGNTTGEKVDKFKKFNLTPNAASCVKAPMIAECYANLECKIYDSKLVAKYNFFILEVVKAWIAPSVKDPKTLHHQGKGVFIVANKRIKLSSKMK